MLGEETGRNRGWTRIQNNRRWLWAKNKWDGYGKAKERKRMSEDETVKIRNRGERD
jgi:hypothetical protein